MVFIISVACLIVGCIAGFALFRYVATGKYRQIIEEASKEAEVIKEKKLLEVKEKFLNKKSELEKEVQQRNQQIQQHENRLKQRELSLNQRQDDLNRKKGEIETDRKRLENQQQGLARREEELKELEAKEREKLEAISGLSADEARERLVESLKDEAKTNAASYINEIMDEAKLTANKEAKRIVIQSIQRVATETAIENSVTVFHIDNDEVKGRIIGREGRNIRALEAATGVEIVVDDTPEAIVISAFDPVRRNLPPGPASARSRRTYPSGTYRRSGSQSDQASGRRNHRNGKTYGHRFGYSRPASGTGTHRGQDEISQQLRTEPVTACP